MKKKTYHKIYSSIFWRWMMMMMSMKIETRMLVFRSECKMQDFRQTEYETGKNVDQEEASVGTNEKWMILQLPEKIRPCIHTHTQLKGWE